MVAGSCNMLGLGIRFNDMYDETTEGEPDERTTPGADEAPRWKWNFKTTPDEMLSFLNAPTPLPQGAVSVSISEAPRGFFIVFFE